MTNLYSFAKAFLINQVGTGNAAELVESYIDMPDGSERPLSLNAVYERLLNSAQNANMKQGVIGKSIGGVHNLRPVLEGFSPRKVINRFGADSVALLDEIIATLNPVGQVRTTNRSLWPKYCQTILSAARFLEQFKSGPEFYAWANSFYSDKRSQAALPLVLAEEIEGIGYPLACDFLKELGFVDYGKPDVHIIDIFKGIGLCGDKVSPYHVQKIITNIANEAGVTAYNVDKLFWLIGSGRFYRHPDMRPIGRKKMQFIDAWNSRNKRRR